MSMKATLMQTESERMKWKNLANATLVGLLGFVAAAGCGSKVARPIGGETGFLESCGSDGDCASGLCACGVCSRTCEQTAECGDQRAACSSGAAACEGETRSVCVPKQTSSDAESDDSMTSASASPTSAQCRGQGHYEAGKEGSYLPCCEGLTEVAQLSPAEGDDGPVCTDLPLRVYACVEGTCGDGICEVGEDVRCGCVDDCPGAAWGNWGSAETTAAENTTADNTTADNTATCDDFGCTVELLPTSAGSVNIRAEFEGGGFCPENFFGSSITLYYAEGNVLVPRPVAYQYPHLCADECPTAPPPVLPTSNASAFTWDGSVRIADAMDTCEFGPQEPCQTTPEFAPPGRYVARVCSKPSQLTAEGSAYCVDPSDELVCADVEFDYPQTEDVVIRLNNEPRPFGSEQSTGDVNTAPFDSTLGVDSTTGESNAVGSASSGDAGTFDASVQ